MKRLINHIRIWNEWRKKSLNSRRYKLKVLFGLVNSPTFQLIKHSYRINDAIESWAESIPETKNAAEKMGVVYSALQKVLDEDSKGGEINENLSIRGEEPGADHAN